MSAARALSIFLLGAVLARAASAQEPEAPAPQAAPPVVVTPAPTSAEQEAAKEAAAKPPEPAPPPKPPLAAFVRGEGFRILSPDGNWRLRVGLQASASYAPTFTSAEKNWASFRVPFARLRVDGHLLRKWIRYWFSFEFASFPPFLLDGYVEVQPWKFFGIRVGQMYTPISWHEYLGPQELLFAEWAVTADYFWTGRDKGAMLFGETDYVDWYFGLFAGSPTRTTTTVAGHFQLMGRLTIHPLGPVGWGEIPYVMAEKKVPFRFSFSLQGYWGKVAPVATGFNPSNGFYQRTDQPERWQAAAAADFLVQWGRWGLFAEYYARRVDPTADPTPSYWQQGFWVQTHVTFYKRILDAALRFNWIDPSNNIANDRFLSGEAQLAWWPSAPYLALRLRYAIGHQQDPGAAPVSDPMLFDIVQLPFRPGTGHLLSLTASAYF